MPALYVAVSLLPVVLFLVVLMLLDSYKLVRPKSVILALGVGALAAIAAYYANTWMLAATGMSSETLSRYAAPFVEEALKAGFVTYVLMSNRVGFTVDAAITGFAVGAGFAVFENVFYLMSHDLGLRAWLIRGLGTAMMHGATMTVYAIIAKSLRERSGEAAFTPYLFAFALAYLLHSGYNHFFLPAEIGAIVQITVFPLIVTALFQDSEKRTRSWLGTGFDTDQELLKLIISGGIPGTRIGDYLSALKEHFAGTVVVDMLCLIRIRVELSVRAKGILMMREAGFAVQPDPSTRAKFSEMKYLEESIGKTGLIAIDPIHKWTSRDLWQLNMLDVSARGE